MVRSLALWFVVPPRASFRFPYSRTACSRRNSNASRVSCSRFSNVRFFPHSIWIFDLPYFQFKSGQLYCFNLSPILRVQLTIRQIRRAKKEFKPVLKHGSNQKGRLQSNRWANLYRLLRFFVSYHSRFQSGSFTLLALPSDIYQNWAKEITFFDFLSSESWVTMSIFNRILKRCAIGQKSSCCRRSGWR